VQYLGDPISLKPGVRYRARLLLTGLATMGSSSQIADTFKGLGFTNVTVYMSNAEVPATWPRATLGQAGGNRYLEGTYQGVPTTMAKPEQIEKVWIA
jgi:hypothetical protein